MNLSLSTGIFPTSLKLAHVKPLIKKHDLDCNILKIIERAVAMRLNNYLSINNLNELFQSAYKSCHSTETALIRVKNDIMMAVDGKKAVVLVLFELSAAFDTIDHVVLFSRLENMFGLTGCALQWFRSYLHIRSQSVLIHKAISEALCLLFGVPQGSVLGTQLFIMYTRPTGVTALKHGVQFHLYADNTQLYATFDVKDAASLTCSLLARSVHGWLKICQT